MIYKLYIFLAAILIVFFSDRKDAQNNSNDFNKDLGNRLNQIIDQELVNQNLMGIQAAVIVPGMGLWSGTSGYSDPTVPDTINIETRFAVASITKTFTAALILKLAEESTINLNDSLHQWLPDFEHINPNITIRQLLIHKSGIYNYTDNAATWFALWTDPERRWQPEEVLQNFLHPELFTPGAEFDYSNTNYILLGMIIREATGSSVSSLYREYFFDPLNLDGTFFPSEESIVGDLVHNWSDRNNDEQVEDFSDRTGTAMFSMSWTAGSIVSTAKDIVRWGEALYGGEVINSASINEIKNFTSINYNTSWTGYSAGTMRFTFEGEEFWGHTGMLTGFRSILAYSKESGISICVLVNQDDFQSVYTIAPLLLKEINSFHITSVSEEESEQIADEFKLLQNYPNPFNQGTVISFVLPVQSHVVIEVYDILGKKVTTIVDEVFEKGTSRINWNAYGLTSGTYIYRLRAGEKIASQKILLVK